MTERYWFAYLTLAIFAASMLINAIALAINVHVMVTLKNYLAWSKEYKVITKAYADMIQEHKVEFARKVAEIALITQNKVELQGTQIREEVRKVAADLKQQAVGIQQQQAGGHPNE